MNLFDYIGRMFSHEVAFGLMLASLLALFLLPMFVMHCTGRNLLAGPCGRLAHREWVVFGLVLTYSRWPISKGWHGCTRHRGARSCTLGLGPVTLQVVRLAPWQASMYRRTYKEAKRQH